MNEAQRVYRRLRELWNAPRATKGPKPQAGSQPFTPGRDPIGLGRVFDAVSEDLGWSEVLAEHEVFARWPELVGPDIAQHSAPERFLDGVLHVKCDSTAWATQLGFLRHDLIQQFAQELPDVTITNIRFFGPNAPSWKKGPRAIPGRGPRDTYG